MSFSKMTNYHKNIHNVPLQPLTECWSPSHLGSGSPKAVHLAAPQFFSHVEACDELVSCCHQSS